MICRIYKLTSPHSDRVYVGSTVQTLNARLRLHRRDYRSGKYCSSCELLKLGEYDVKIELLEEIEIEHKKDPKKRKYEQKWMDCTENTCNILRADGTGGTEYWREHRREYFRKHREEISRYQAEKVPC